MVAIRQAGSKHHAPLARLAKFGCILSFAAVVNYLMGLYSAVLGSMSPAATGMIATENCVVCDKNRRGFVLSTTRKKEDPAMSRKLKKKRSERTIRELPETPECAEVHCVDGPLIGGLNNQLMGYFGLALIALRSSSGGENQSCICLPDVRSEYPRGKDKRKYRPIANHVNLTQDSWPPSLPRLYFGSLAEREDDEHNVRIVKHPWMAIYKNDSKRHPLRRPFFQGILSHPAKDISAALEGLRLPKEYMAIHARVEKDIRDHWLWDEFQGRNLSDILQVTRRGLVMDQRNKRRWNERMQKAMDHVVIAVGTEILEEDKRVLEQGQPPWGENAKMRRIEKPSTLDYWGSALIDMVVCINATVFVGFSGSTFSVNVALLRNDPSSTFKYNKGELVEWRP